MFPFLGLEVALVAMFAGFVMMPAKRRVGDQVVELQKVHADLHAQLTAIEQADNYQKAASLLASDPLARLNKKLFSTAMGHAWDTYVSLKNQMASVSMHIAQLEMTMEQPAMKVLVSDKSGRVMEHPFKDLDYVNNGWVNKSGKEHKALKRENRELNQVYHAFQKVNRNLEDEREACRDEAPPEQIEELEKATNDTITEGENLLTDLNTRLRKAMLVGFGSVQGAMLPHQALPFAPGLQFGGMAPMSQGGSKPPRAPKPTDQCHRCKQFGHFVNMCLNPPAPRSWTKQWVQQGFPLWWKQAGVTPPPRVMRNHQGVLEQRAFVTESVTALLAAGAVRQEAEQHFCSAKNSHRLFEVKPDELPNVLKEFNVMKARLAYYISLGRVTWEAAWTACVERGFSRHRIIKNRLTNRLKLETVDSLLRVGMLGPAADTGAKPLIDQAAGIYSRKGYTGIIHKLFFDVSKINLNPYGEDDNEEVATDPEIEVLVQATYPASDDEAFSDSDYETDVERDTDESSVDEDFVDEEEDAKEEQKEWAAAAAKALGFR
ncbi:hypothetical protein VOLCADRAFT_103752 [Volvox carteri f. nagariensis]|uniref:CCHC-type domain-containing protein n=1 Tax=Volvox carteri f. nagariensis TaxID=3068 RepID=D8TNA9_VOLCA|nr:uncharacterized protein VOLCADRAFT_103752 [Volvox carteri f. nagariensis]EFJ50957.1 hypothetical protein VOLCADRAFT_103752 [Volvox carteri f. nagariensis]|eukprot:XP_002947969.1 hypothetical protein VOLCADRAFT_103752 [Volvox carteri f. nagariensis]